MNHPKFTSIQATCPDWRQQENSVTFLLQIINSISDPIFVKDRQHCWVLFNNAFCNFIGHSREELLGKSDYDFFPTHEAEVFWEKDELVFSTGIANENEEHLTDAFGVTHVISTKKSLFEDETGNKFLVCIIRDITHNITKYQRIEAELQQSKQLLQLVIDNIPQQIFWKDRNSVYLGCNRNGASVVGVGSPQDIVGKTDYDLPTTKQESDWYRSGDRRVICSGIPELHIIETQLQADGKQAWLDTNKIPLRDANGNVIGVLVTIEDITERQQAQQQLNIQYTITQVLASATSLQSATKKLIQAICENLDWDLGELWILDSQRNQLRYFTHWHSASLDVTEFEAVTKEITFACGVGLPGRTQLCNQPVWMDDVTSEQTFLRGQVSAKAGLHSAFGFPINSAVGPLGVITLFSRQVRQKDSSLLQMLAAIGNQLGQFVERKRAEEALSVAYAEMETLVLKRTKELADANEALQAEIAERKQAALALVRTNAVLQAQQEASIDAILIVDENLQVLSYNKGFAEIWQIPFEVVQAGDDQQILPLAVEKTSKPEEFLAKVQYLYQHPEQSSRDEVALKDGRTLDRYSAPVRSPVGDFYGRIWYFRDITERKQAEVALLQSEARLRQQAKELELALDELQRTQINLVQSAKMSSLGQLVAGIAHEVNNPVNFIYGNLSHTEEYIKDLLALLQFYQQHYPHPVPEIQDFIQQVELDFLQSDLQQILNSMKVGAERIRSIVLSLRTFSRLDEAEMKTVDIHEGIDSTLMILQSRLNPRSQNAQQLGDRHHPAIEVIKEYSDLPLVECYAGQLNQVFLNILTNAIDAIEDGNGKWVIGNREENSNYQLPITNYQFPTIRIITELTGNNQVIIRIADNGLGIPEDVKQRIFDPFFTTKPIGKGTGLGLSISYQIITSRHGGSLQCISEPGHGTEFVITIPLIQQC